MKVYVASKFENKTEVRKAMELLKKDGHTITFDWTIHDDTGMTGQTREDYLLMSAMHDMGGVRTADAVFLICYPGMKGAMVEVGMAIALGLPVVVVKREIWENVFFHLPNCFHVNSIEEGIAAINEKRIPEAAKVA